MALDKSSIDLFLARIGLISELVLGGFCYQYNQPKIRGKFIGISSFLSLLAFNVFF